jgi:hypothetical protein
MSKIQVDSPPWSVQEVERDYRGYVTSITYLYKNIILEVVRFQRDVKGNVSSVTRSKT